MPHPAPNTEHPASTNETAPHVACAIGCWTLGVRCWMLDRRSPGVRPKASLYTRIHPGPRCNWHRKTTPYASLRHCFPDYRAGCRRPRFRRHRGHGGLYCEDPVRRLPRPLPHFLDRRTQRTNRLAMLLAVAALYGRRRRVRRPQSAATAREPSAAPKARCELSSGSRAWPSRPRNWAALSASGSARHIG